MTEVSAVSLTRRYGPGRHRGAVMITASANGLTVTLGANGEAVIITASTNDLADNPAVAPGVRSVRGAWQHDTDE